MRSFGACARCVGAFTLFSALVITACGAPGGSATSLTAAPASATAAPANPTAAPTNPTAAPIQNQATAMPAPATAAPTQGQTGGAKVTILVDAGPGPDDEKGKASFQALVDRFHKVRPDVEIQSVPGGYDPQQFAAKMAAGTVENAFGVWFTEVQKLINQGVAADITDYFKQWEHFDEIRPETLKVVTGPDGRIYGIPIDTYGIGMVYHRTLFEKAGLDPDRPPETWEELRQYAKQIKDKTGAAGFAISSKDNVGGWQFTTILYTMGVDVEKNVNGTWVAALNDPKVLQALQMLKEMRWTDGSMTEEQLLDRGKIEEMMATDRVAMMLGGPDNPGGMATQYATDIKNFGVAQLPQDGGDATISGGYAYMFSAKSSPEQLKAAIDWVLYRYFAPQEYELGLKEAVERGDLIGHPSYSLFKSGPFLEERRQILAKYANVPQEIYQPFLAKLDKITLKLEPPIEAQALYAELTNVLQAVLTDQSADPKALLETANKNVQAVLDKAQQ
jgi:ABC-type glycerol-3-phosphate transport system substrate-binding protein